MRDKVSVIQWDGPGEGTSKVMDFCGTRFDGDEELLNFVPLAYPTAKLYNAAKDEYVWVMPGNLICKDELGLFVVSEVRRKP